MKISIFVSFLCVLYTQASDNLSSQPTVGVVVVEEKAETPVEGDKQSKRSLPHHDDLYGSHGYGVSVTGAHVEVGIPVAVAGPGPVGPVALVPGAGLYSDPVLPDAVPFGNAYAPAFAPGYGGPVAGPLDGAYPLEQLVSQRVEINHAVPVPVYRTVAVAVPHPVPVGVPQPVAVHVPHPVPFEVPVVKTVPYPVEKPVPYPVEKPYPVKIIKKVPVPVPKPYPVHVPIYKVKHIYHHAPNHWD